MNPGLFASTCGLTRQEALRAHGIQGGSLKPKGKYVCYKYNKTLGMSKLFMVPI